MDRRLIGDICECGDAFCAGCDDADVPESSEVPRDATFDTLIATSTDAIARAQDMADANGAPVRVWTRDGWFVIDERPDDDLPDPTPESQGWAEYAIVDPAPRSTFRVLRMDPRDGTEQILEFTAATLSEALAMAERADAGHASMIYGVLPADYAIARAEGIAFNEADGLLVDAE